VRGALGALPVIALAAFLAVRTPPGRRLMELPAGVTEVASEIVIESGTEVRGAPSGTVLRAAPGFRGRSLLVVRGNGVRLHDFTIDGNRAALEERTGLPPANVAFADFTRGNGVLAEGVCELAIENVAFRNIAGFAILVSRGRDVTIDRVSVFDSGSRDAAGRNNTTGGILLEEGTANFRVSRSELRRIRGNGVWTHSLYTSPRNTGGQIVGNSFEVLARDAIQVGHATQVRVENNRGSRIGFPVEDVDMEHRAVPVAIDTAGNVENCRYIGNDFSEINGKAIDLDGFHDGEVRGNAFRNRLTPDQYPYGGFGIVMNNSNPDMQSRHIRIEGNRIDGAKFGGIFVIGWGHRIERNRLENLNRAHCNEEAARFGCYYAPGEPEMLESGIYLGRGADRPAPAEENVVCDNYITGFRMGSRCIGRAPGIPPGANEVRGNICLDR
jgi:hypothetical protein